MTQIVQVKIGVSNFDPTKNKDYRHRLDAGRVGGEETARTNFYGQRNRQTPSLPKLSFLEKE